MSIRLYTLISLSLLIVSALSAQHQEPVNIILDTDMGSDCDDVGALALLHQYTDQGKVEIIGVMYSSGKVPYGAGVVEAINVYYGRPDIPVGAYQGSDVGDEVDKMTAEKYGKDWNFFFNGTAPYTKYLVEHFPAPVYYVDGGADVLTGKSLKATPPGNIVRTAYRDWLWNVEQKTLDDQRPSWDLVTVYFAVEGLGPYLESAGEGWLEFDVDHQVGLEWQAWR